MKNLTNKKKNVYNSSKRMTEVSQIEQVIKNLIKVIFGVDVILASKQTLKGLEIVLDCPREYKGKILGKKGRTMKTLRDN